MDLIIQTTPAVIDTNYDQIHNQVEAEVAKYGDVVVTSDTLTGAKKMATHLNKLKAEIAKRRKEVVSLASQPVREFEEKVKALETMCEEGRQRIKGQVEKFEQVTLDRIHNALKGHLVECYEDGRVAIEFQSVQIDDLVKLGAFTATGKLTKAARDAVESRVMACQHKQSRTELRISQLENESHRAGLHSPLTREHIAGFLFEEDNTAYAVLLVALINRELERQAETLARAEQAAASKAALAAAEEQAAQSPDFEAPEDPANTFEPHDQETNPPGVDAVEMGGTVEDCGYIHPSSIDEPHAFQDRAPLTKQAQIEEQIRPSTPPPERVAMAPAPAGSRIVHVSVSLKLDVPVGATLEAVEVATRKKLAKAGVEKSILSIFAAEVAHQGAA